MKFRPILFLLGILCLSACNFSLTEDVTPPLDYVSPTPLPDIGNLYPEILPLPARGEEFYSGYCAPCHGEDGLGNGVMASQLPVAVPAIGLADIASHVSPAEWYTIISRGNMERGMPPYYDFSAEERWDVLAYVFLLSSSPEKLQQGKVLYETNCSECHGLSGSYNLKVDFSDQEYMSLTTNLNLYRSIAEGKGEMKSFSGKLSEDDLWAVTAYIRSLSFDMSALESTYTVTPQNTQTVSPGPVLMSESTSSATPEGTPIVGEAVETPILVTAEATGYVTNGSGTKLDNDLSARLIYYNTSEQQVINTEITQIDSDGIFSFKNIFVDSKTAFWVTVEYQGVSYYSQYVVFDGSTYVFDLPVVVYDASFEWSDLHFDLVHISLDISNGSAEFSELFVISNPGPSTVIINTDGTSLPFIRLPEGVIEFSGLSPDSRGSSFLPATDGIALPPTAENQYAVVASFSIPYERRLDFIQEFPMTVNSISLFVPEGVRIKTSQLGKSSTQEVEEKIYQYYEISDFSDGVLSFTVTGTPGEGGSRKLDQRSWIVIGTGALGVLFMGLGIYLFLRDRKVVRKEKERDKLQPLDGIVAENSTYDSSNDILDAIIALDEKFKNGDISNKAYQNRRKILIDKLKALQ